MEISKQQYVSVQLSYGETKDALEQYVRSKLFLEKNLPLVSYDVEDYDPDCSRSSKVTNNDGAFFLFIRDETPTKREK